MSSTPAGHSLSSLASVRRILAHDASGRGVADPAHAANALQGACDRVCEALRAAMGDDGCNALLARSLARTEAYHPLLKDVRQLSGGVIRLDGVVATVDTHGIAAVTLAVEAWLAALLDVLSRLIGEDMAIRLIDPTAADWPSNGASP